jgi:hypothetical protein
VNGDSTDGANDDKPQPRKRDGAIASFKLRHIDVVEGKVDQDARDVQTKFSKSLVTTFFPWVKISA